MGVFAVKKYYVVVDEQSQLQCKHITDFFNINFIE